MDMYTKFDSNKKIDIYMDLEAKLISALEEIDKLRNDNIKQKE